MKPTFKADNGRWITQALFFERTHNCTNGRPYAVYTLKDEDHVDKDGRKYKSLKKLFLETNDPTEYTFACTHLGGWGHWKELQASNEIAPFIEEWREERDIALVSMGVVKLVKMAQDKEGNYQAAKYLADKGWVHNPRGRPDAASIKKEARRIAETKRRVNNDLERLRGITKQ